MKSAIFQLALTSGDRTRRTALSAGILAIGGALRYLQQILDGSQSAHHPTKKHDDEDDQCNLGGVVSVCCCPLRF